MREDLRTRLGWGHVFGLKVLSEPERRSVLRQAADARGVFLSDEVMDFMLTRFSGQDYRAADAPMAELGILLEAKAVHTGRSARNHLLALAQTNGIGARQVDEVLDMVGLRDVGTDRVNLGRLRRQQSHRGGSLRGPRR